MPTRKREDQQRWFIQRMDTKAVKWQAEVASEGMQAVLKNTNTELKHEVPSLIRLADVSAWRKRQDLLKDADDAKSVLHAINPILLT
jgi:hypothetical protein